MSRVALYGGTFDPVHAGHVAIANAARVHLGLARVHFIPCRLSPHKIGQSPPSCGRKRAEMLEIALRNLPWAIVDGRELGREGVSYSWQTAEEFHRDFPQAELFWIMGADQWAALPDWAKPERLADLVEFVVISRGSQVPRPRAGFRSTFLQLHHPASSSKIRAAISSGVPVPDGWLAPAVVRFIRHGGLYR